MNIVKVPGKNSKHKVFVYALSTCVWCKMTKNFLNEHKVAFEYVDVDLCSEEDKEKIRRDIWQKGEEISYPTIVIDEKVLIHGFRSDEIKKALGI